MKEYRLYAGAYTDGRPGNGVFFLRFGADGLRAESVCGGVVNTSYVLPVGDKLYAVEELDGEAAVLEFSPAAGISYKRRAVPGSGLCHIAACGPFLYASGYAGGTLTGLRQADGGVCCFLRHTGHSVRADRQAQAHVHAALPSPDGRLLLVADLGMDRLFRYVVGPDGSLTPDGAQPWVCAAPGQGPRHFAFHPNGAWLYLVAELERSLLVFRSTPSGLQLTATHALRQAGDPADSLAADVHVTPDGRFVYASVRGADCIECFRVLENGGRLEPVGRFSSGGRCPRSFAISPDGLYLAAANQESGNVTVFPRNAQTGALESPAGVLALPQAACVKWADRREKTQKFCGSAAAD